MFNPAGFTYSGTPSRSQMPMKSVLFSMSVRENAVLSNVIFGFLLIFTGANVPLSKLPMLSEEAGFTVTKACVPPKATMPILTSGGRSWTNDLAALCAAVIRLGSTSRAPMLSDTSITNSVVR